MTSAWSLGRVTLVGLVRVPARYDVYYETPRLATVLMIKAQRNIYDPDVYARGGFVITMYTPAYHYLVAALPVPRDSPFLAGRLLDAAFMTLAAGLVFVIGRRRATWFLPILAFGGFFSYKVAVQLATVFMNDPMALFFSASAVVLVGTRERGVGRVLLAAACGCLAFFTKQTYLTGAVSAFVFLAAVDRRNARVFALTCGAILVLGGLFAQLCWGSGFWFCTFVAPRNPMLWRMFAHQWWGAFHQPTFVFVLAAAGIVVIHFIRHDRWRVVLDSPYLIYVAVTTAVLLATVAKEGSGDNYFIEPFLACLLWLTFSLDDPDWGRKRNLGPILAIALFCICEGFELAVAHPPGSFISQDQLRFSDQDLDRVRYEVESLGVRDPRVLNLARFLAHTVKPRPGEVEGWRGYLDPRVTAVNDSLLYRILWRTGVLPPEALRDAIMRREFDVILVPHDVPTGDSTPPHLRVVVEAVLARYRLARDGEYLYYVK